MQAKNKAKIERQELNTHYAKDHANRALEAVGHMLKPYGFNYQGAVAVHMYEMEGADTTYAFVCQTTGLANIPEQECDAAMKEARTTLMTMYGRKDTRRLS